MLSEKTIARLIIINLCQCWRVGLDERIIAKEEYVEKCEEHYTKMARFVEEAERFIARTSVGIWDQADQDWIKQFLTYKD